jgi:hypothetical protein
MGGTSNPAGIPQGVTLDPPSAPPPGVTLDTTPTAPPSGVTLDPPVQQPHWYDTAVNELKELNTGFTTGLSQTGLTAERAIGSIPVVGPAFTAATQQARADDAARAAQPLNTPGRMAGNAIENILEFAGGDEALKGASTIDTIKNLEPVAKALKAHPELTNVVMNMIRQGTVGTAQAAGHGATGGRAIATGALTAAGGGILEGTGAGATKLASMIAPTTESALGETYPVLASQLPGAAPIAEKIAAIGSEPKIAAAQQFAAQRGIVNRAQQAARDVLENMNTARQSRWVSGEANFNPAAEPEIVPASPDRQLPSGQAQLPAATATPGQPQLEAGTAPTGLARTNEVGPLEGEIPEPQPGQTQPTTAGGGAPTNRVSFIEERPPNFQPIDSNAAVQNVNSFKDAANVIRQHAGPVYDQLDAATGGDFTKLRTTLADAYDDQDYAKVRETEDAIDSLFDRSSVKNNVDRTDYQTAKSAWRSSKILDAVDAQVSRAFNIQDASLASDADAWRGLSGAKLMTGINNLTNRYGRATIDSVIGNDGLSGLTRLASRIQTPRNAAMYGQVIGDVANELGVPPAKAGIVGSTVNWARRQVLHSLATNPTVARYIDYAATNRVAPRIFAPLIAATINRGGAYPTQPTPQGGQQ